MTGFDTILPMKKKTPILDQTAYLIARRSEIQTEGLNQQDLKLQCWTHLQVMVMHGRLYRDVHG